MDTRSSSAARRADGPRSVRSSASLSRAPLLRWLALTGVTTAGALAPALGCDTGEGAGNRLYDAPEDEGSAPPAQANDVRFDYASFESVIQPILDSAESKGCTAAACHGAPGGQAGFALARQPGPGSAEMQANFAAVTARCNADAPGSSVFYARATNRHAGGKSALISQAQATQILSWIAHASPPPATPPPPPAEPGSAATPPAPDGGAAGGAPAPGGGKPNCIPPDRFNVGVFTSKILPLMLGEVDYNAPPGQAISYTGCGRASCHGANRGPQALYISASNTPAQNLQSFGCFVNAAAPSESSILACPLNAPGCPKSPHPGQNVFRDPTDRNYQRMLSFLYATQGVQNPFDFAFFARQISPVFKDPAFGGLGNTGQRTCANTSTCHGVSVAGATPPNLSNFPMLANATTREQLLVDYWTASNFANFTTPQGSELFLFPTDLTSDPAQPFANGLHHAGGINFGDDSARAAASAPARAILEWAAGLRPDEGGNLRNWLVAGTYSAAQITQPTTVGDETRLAPKIFDNSGAFQFNNGQWDALASPNAEVDLNAVFPGAPGSGRVAYAVAYAMNTTAADIPNVLVNVTSPNVVLVYADGRPIAQSAGDGSTATGVVSLPAFSATRPSTRILLKVLQRANDRRFAFRVSLTNQQSNQPLSNTSGELIFRLDPSGGI